MALFTRKNHSRLLGIDIGATAVRLLDISVENNRFKVEHYGFEPVMANALQDRNVYDVEAVGAAISRAYMKSRSRLKNAAAAIAGASVYTKIIDVDRSFTDAELEMQLRLEAEQYIPFPISEVNMDFEVQGVLESSPLRKQVLLAAAKREFIDARVDAIEVAGLNTKVMEVENYAIERAAALIVPELDGEPNLVAVFDIGHSTTTLIVLQEGQVVYSREQMFGGKHLYEDIQRRYGLNFDDTRRAMMMGTLPEDYRVDVLPNFTELIVQQISRSLQFFYSSNKFNDVDYILLTGGCAKLEGLSRYVKDRLGNRVSVANPFMNMSFSSSVDLTQLEKDAPSLMVACGLALRSYE